MSTPYDNSFFEHMDDSAARSSGVIVPLLMDFFTPTSLLDVGSGTGGWAARFASRGLGDFLCIDGDYVETSTLHVPIDRFKPSDLSEPFDLNRRFDLAISLEVAEHLPAASADGFVSSITRHADIVVFSAAIPHQGGTNHINEQWPNYWAEKFRAAGYRCFDWLRPLIWDNPDVSWWYKQNTLIYAKDAVISSFPRSAELLSKEVKTPAALVHPGLFLSYAEALDGLQSLTRVPRLPWAAKAVVKSAGASIHHRIGHILGPSDKR